MKKLLLTAALLSTVLTGCSTSPTGRSQLMLVSPQSAIVESKKAYLSTVNEFDQKRQLVSDPRLVKRVATITGRLVTEAVKQFPNSKNWEWSVAIVNDPKTVNAWCMAGGRMAIYTGLIQQLKLTDDEMAQIMGHEIGHALANHTAERMSVAMAGQMGALVTGILTDSQAALQGAALAAQMALTLPNSRAGESEADHIGMMLAAKAGYEPDAAVSLWRKMGSLGDGDRPPEFLSTHPSPGNREAALAAMIPEARAANPSGKKASVHPVTIVQ